MSVKCIVGLGNPGKEYERNRHNVGFMVIDAIMRSRPVSDSRENKLFWHGRLKIGRDDAILVKPLTFMNRSGEAVRACLDSFDDLAVENLLTVVDDVNLPIGQLRFRVEGSAGGHHGLESIVEILGTSCFPRLRIGVAEEDLTGKDLTDYVLGDFRGDSWDRVSSALSRAQEACLLWVSEGPRAVMNQFNQKAE